MDVGEITDKVAVFADEYLMFSGADLSQNRLKICYRDIF